LTPTSATAGGDGTGVVHIGGSGVCCSFVMEKREQRTRGQSKALEVYLTVDGGQ